MHDLAKDRRFKYILIFKNHGSEAGASLEMMPKLTKVAGFEWGTGFYINPMPPEDATRHLRDAGA